MRFDKLARSIDEQIALLQERGMEIHDTALAYRHLSHRNYYRLTAYWLPFETDHATHMFKPGTQFEDVLRLYTFDRELRLLMLDAIERVEISFRTQWAYHLAHQHGPHAYLDARLARNQDHWQSNLDSLRVEIERSSEIFVKHYRRTYTVPDLPPVWVACEVMSLGTLSRWFANLKPTKTRAAIARTYKLDHGVLATFIHHLTHVRNVCAHHSRLWNRRFTITMKLPQTKPEGLAANFHLGADRRLYNTLVMMLWILDCVDSSQEWKTALLELVRSHNIDVAETRYTLLPLSMWFYLRLPRAL